MIDFRIEQLIPTFLLEDKNGYAIAKAMEAALNYLLDRCQTGMDTLQNVDKMPEWRLDEIADELNCLYDYNADIEAKRRWISNATPLFYAYGTPQSIYNYLDGYFDEVELEEYWQYAGAPYHFRVTVSGRWNAENEAWLRRAITAAKNVRSVLDDIAVGSGTTIVVHGEGGMLARYGAPLTGDGLNAGTYPEESFVNRTAEIIYEIATHDARAHMFPYTQAGTQPETVMEGGKSDGRIAAVPATDGHVYPFPSTKDAPAGIHPETSIAGAICDGTSQTDGDGKATAFSYTPCAEETPCGGGTL